MSEHTVSDEDWARALECAMSCLHGIPITAAELDNAMQHAFGMLSLRKTSAITNSHAELMKALEEISKQMTSVEMFAEHGDDPLADYETGYDAIINAARAVLSKATPFLPLQQQQEAARKLK
jgi:hypothetical protein